VPWLTILDSDNYTGFADTKYLRKDIADTKSSGDLTFNDAIRIKFGSSGDWTMLHDGVNNLCNLINGNLLIRDNTTTRFTFERTTGDFTATGGVSSDYWANGGASSGSDAEAVFTSNSMPNNSLVVQGNTTGSVNYPSSFGQGLFIKGTNEPRDFAFWRNNADNNDDIYVGNKNGTAWVWNKVIHAGNATAELTQFLRSNDNDSTSGQLTVNNRFIVNDTDTTVYASTLSTAFAQTFDNAVIINNSATTNAFASLFMQATGDGLGTASGRMILKNDNGGSGKFIWQLRDNAHTGNTQEKMSLDSDGNLVATGKGTFDSIFSTNSITRGFDSLTKSGIQLNVSSDNPQLDFQRWTGVGNNFRGNRFYKDNTENFYLQFATSAIPASQVWNTKFTWDNSGNFTATGEVRTSKVNATDSDLELSAAGHVKVVLDNNSNSANDFTVHSQSTANSALFMVKESGDVGIGINNPQALTHIYKSEAEAQLKIEGGKATVLAIGEINSSILFGSNDGSVSGTGEGVNQVAGKIASITEATNGSKVGMGFYTFNQSAATAEDRLYEHMRLTNEGKLGIGTATPQDKLHVQDYVNATNRVAMFKGGATTIGDYSYITINNGFSAEYTKEVRLAAVSELSNSNYTGLAFFTSPDSAGAAGHERMRITALGLVGIGTTAPEGDLHISRTGDASLIVEADSGNTTETNNPTIELWQDGAVVKAVFGNEGTGGNNVTSSLDNYAYIGTTTNTGGLHLISNNNVRATVLTNGNFLINRTTDGGYKLDVNGTGRFSSDLRVGEGSVDNFNRTYYSDGTYTEMRGYGIQMSRSTSYIRPTTDGTATLQLGSNVAQWATLLMDATVYNLNTNGTRRINIASGGQVGIGNSNTTYKLDVSGTGRFTGDVIVPAETYGSGWNGSNEVPTKNDVYDKIENLQGTSLPTSAGANGEIVYWGGSATFAAGDVVYLSVAGTWTIADADASTSKQLIGVALGTSAATNGILLKGAIYNTAYSGLSLGLPLYLSNTPGDFITTAPTGAGDYVRVLGYKVAANVVYFRPDNTWIVNP